MKKKGEAGRVSDREKALWNFNIFGVEGERFYGQENIPGALTFENPLLDTGVRDAEATHQSLHDLKLLDLNSWKSNKHIQGLGWGGEDSIYKRSSPLGRSAESLEGSVAGNERKRSSLRYISQKTKRSVTFSKRKKGIMKKAYELSLLTGSQVLLLISNENGHVYTFATSKLKPVITEHEHLINQYLNT